MRETIPLGGHHLFDIVVARRLQRFYERIATRQPDARTILDLGCGPGHLAAALARHHQEAQVLGMDVDPRQIRIAQRHEAPNLRYQVGASQALPLPDASQDWILATETFHHWDRTEEALHAVHRALKPGGEFWIVEGAGDMTRDEIGAWAGRRPGRLLAWWIRQVFTRHGYLPEALEQDVLEPLRHVFDTVDVEREDGWFVVRASKA